MHETPTAKMTRAQYPLLARIPFTPSPQSPHQACHSLTLLKLLNFRTHSTQALVALNTLTHSLVRVNALFASSRPPVSEFLRSAQIEPAKVWPKPHRERRNRAQLKLARDKYRNSRLKLVHRLVVFSLSIHSLCAWSSPYYYPKALFDGIQSEKINDSDLRFELNRVLKDAHLPGTGNQHDQVLESCHSRDCYRHHPLSYKRARKILFGRIHLRRMTGRYLVEDVYCSRWLREDQFDRRPPGPDTIPDPRIINAEHTWPQSRFSRTYGKHFQKSDLHALYPSDSRANSSRGNHPFGEVRNQHSQICQASRRGNSTRSGRTVFEPPLEHKGNVARALFYFAIRYELPIDDEQEAYLRLWDQLDPVDSRELDRNDLIFESQLNRNPFVDFENLARLIADF